MYCWVSFDPAGSHDHPSGDTLALASGGLSPPPAVEVALAGRRPQIGRQRSHVRMVSGAPTTLMRDLDCLPTIESKAHHRHTKKTMTTQAHEGWPRSPSMRFARHDEIGGRRRQLCNVIRLIGSNRALATPDPSALNRCPPKAKVTRSNRVGCARFFFILQRDMRARTETPTLPRSSK
jgi:hypothetical protein